MCVRVWGGGLWQRVKLDVAKVHPMLSRGNSLQKIRIEKRERKNEGKKVMEQASAYLELFDQAHGVLSPNPCVKFPT